MNYYLVFGGRKWEGVMGKKGITWEVVGVFRTETPENACLKAAQQHGVGTCFAIEGFAWGVDTLQADEVSELGVELDPISRLERMGRTIEKGLTRALASGGAPQLREGNGNDGE